MTSKTPSSEGSVQNKRLCPGDGFGEIALLYDAKRTATVRALEDCAVWVLEGDLFKKIIIKTTLERRNVELSFLDRVELFR